MQSSQRKTGDIGEEISVKFLTEKGYYLVEKII
jgi:Holliday junction resolvase-like predicted endonuclease